MGFCWCSSASLRSWVCVSLGWPVHTHTPLPSVNLTQLQVFIHMLLKTLFCGFFRACNSPSAAGLLDFSFPSTAGHNSKPASDATQRQTFLEIRETSRSSGWPFDSTPALCRSFLLTKDPKGLGVDCREAHSPSFTPLHNGAVGTGWPRGVTQTWKRLLT